MISHNKLKILLCQGWNYALVILFSFKCLTLEPIVMVSFIYLFMYIFIVYCFLYEGGDLLLMNFISFILHVKSVRVTSRTNASLCILRVR